MNIDRLWADIESDLTWRLDEIRFFQNKASFIEPEDQNQFRRAIILLLYAHFEGFCKFAFTLYIDSINKIHLKCRDVNFSIVAASLSSNFAALRDPSSKCDLFRNSLPDDTKLHLYSREKEFIERFNEFENMDIEIPDDLINTESNLKPIVLRKLLFRLGFQHDQFKELEGKIEMLLNIRNKIAHGEMKDGISERLYNEVKDSTIFILNEIKSNVMQSLYRKTYLRVTTV